MRHVPSVQPVHRVKNVNHEHPVKSASHVRLQQPKQRQLKKKHCRTTSNCWMTNKTAPMASVHVAVHAASVVAATVANVKAMPTAT